MTLTAPRNAAHVGATRLLERAWAGGALTEPRLDAAALAHRLELDEEMAPVLQILAAALSEEAQLNPIGRTMAYWQIRNILADRARALQLWRDHPEILERPIAAPVIVLGQMRSGTTRLQRLLACDPHFVGTRFFEAARPVPMPGPIDMRKLRSHAALIMLQRLNPALAAVHPSDAAQEEEQFGLLSFSLYGAQLEAQWRVPSFAAFWRERGKAEVYRDFKRLLQTIGWHRGDDPARPWLLKAPQFMEDLDAVLTIFPDARLICLDRDPAAVVGSSASLVWNQMAVQSDAADPLWIGRNWLKIIAYRQAQAERALAAHPHVQRLAVDFDATNRDWLAEMRRIYGFLGLPLSAATEQRMTRFMASPSPHKAHHYRLEDFGLTRREVEATLGRYAVAAA